MIINITHNFIQIKTNKTRNSKVDMSDYIIQMI